MKKSIYILTSLFVILFTTPIFAQVDPGDDPDAVPVDDYVWILAIVAISFAILKFRAIIKQSLGAKN